MINLETYSYPKGLALLKSWQAGNEVAREEMRTVFDAAISAPWVDGVMQRMQTWPDQVRVKADPILSAYELSRCNWQRLFDVLQKWRADSAADQTWLTYQKRWLQPMLAHIPRAALKQLALIKSLDPELHICCYC